MYHRLEAEVAGGFGPGIDYARSRDPRLVRPLHYEFQGWLGDDIVTTSGYWIVTGELADALRVSTLSGYALDEVVITKEQQFDYFPTPRPFPERWERLVPCGDAQSGDDFVLETRVDLLVSDAALALLQTFHLTEADVFEAEEPPVVGDVMTQFLAQQRAKGDDI